MKKYFGRSKNLRFPLIILLIFSLATSYGDEFPRQKKPSYLKKTYIYKTVDGHGIKADVYTKSVDKRQPAILYIHGGALIMGSRTGIQLDQVETLLEAGYSVVAIDYRLAPETKLPAIIEDLEDAYSWVRAEGSGVLNIDPDRIAVMGMSAGGYLTLMAGFRLNPRPKALVSFYGYGDITGHWYSRPSDFYKKKTMVSEKDAFKSVGGAIISETFVATSTGRFNFYLYCRQRGLWPKLVSGHDPEKERAWFFPFEPLHNVTSTYPPTMLLHGEMDTDVPFEQSVLMAEELRRQGVDHEFMSRSEWGHGFDLVGVGEPTVHAAFTRVLAFLKKHV